LSFPALQSVESSRRGLTSIARAEFSISRLVSEHVSYPLNTLILVLSIPGINAGAFRTIPVNLLEGVVAGCNPVIKSTSCSDTALVDTDQH
jgi:hypothetical protein